MGRFDFSLDTYSGSGAIWMGNPIAALVFATELVRHRDRRRPAFPRVNSLVQSDLFAARLLEQSAVPCGEIDFAERRVMRYAGTVPSASCSSLTVSATIPQIRP